MVINEIEQNWATSNNKHWLRPFPFALYIEHIEGLGKKYKEKNQSCIKQTRDKDEKQTGVFLCHARPINSVCSLQII